MTFEQWVLELWYFTLVFCNKTSPWVPLFSTLWPWPWSFTHFMENFNLVNNFWTMSARALTFSHEYHMRQEISVSTNNFDLVTLTLVFDLLFENLLTLLITMELWGLEHWYVTWVFLVTEPFHGYQYFLPCDLDLVFFSSSNEVWCRVGAANVHNFMLHAFFCLEHVFIFL